MNIYRKALLVSARLSFWLLGFCVSYWIASLLFALVVNAMNSSPMCEIRSSQTLIPAVICTGFGFKQATHHLLGLPVALLFGPIEFARFGYILNPMFLIASTVHAAGWSYLVIMLKLRFTQSGR